MTIAKKSETEAVREALLQILKREREEALEKKHPPRWAGLTTATVKVRLAKTHRRGLASIRRHLHALEDQGLIREVGFGPCVWQYIHDEDRQREAEDVARREKATQLEAALAAHFGIPEDYVTVHPHTESMISADLSMAERLLHESSVCGRGGPHRRPRTSSNDDN